MEALGIPLHRVAERCHQVLQFVEAAMHIANNVERAALAASIRPHRLSLDFKSVQFFWGLEDVDTTKALPFESTQRSTQLLRLIADDVRPKVSIRSVSIPLVAKFLRELENNRD